MVRCAVLNCDTRSDAKQASRRRRTHGFPAHPSVRRDWIRACGRANYVPTFHSVVCCRHFRLVDYILTGDLSSKKRLLKPDAIPSQCLPTANIEENDQLHLEEQMHVDHENPVPVPVPDGSSAPVENNSIPESVQIEDPEKEDLRVQLGAQKAINKRQSALLAGQEALNKRQKCLIDDLRLENAENSTALNRIFNEDQIYRAKNPKSTTKKFSGATMKRAIQTYYTCGHTGYELLLQQGN